MRKVVFGFAIAAGVAGALLGAYSALGSGAGMFVPDEYSEGQLRVGDLAPDLELERVDGTGRVPLSHFHREKPLVLILGSYT